MYFENLELLQDSL